MKRWALAGLACVLVGACDQGTDPDLSAPNVVFVSVSAATGGPGEWQVPTAMRNEGGPGSFHVRFYAVPAESPDGSEEICGFTDAITVAAGWTDIGSWNVPCQTRPTTVAVRSLQPDTGEFLETDRASIP